MSDVEEDHYDDDEQDDSGDGGGGGRSEFFMEPSVERFSKVYQFLRNLDTLPRDLCHDDYSCTQTNTLFLQTREDGQERNMQLLWRV